MGVAGNQGGALRQGLGQQGPLKPQHSSIQVIQAPSQPQAQIGTHLIVATAAGVQLLPNRT